MTDDLPSLRAVDRADVYKGGHHAATLTRTADGVAFAYLPAWLAEDRPPVAISLPLSDEPVLRPSGAVPAFFEGLLPEGRRLGTLRREVKTSADDELSLLLAVGADAVGDVQVVPEGVTPHDVEPRVRVDDPADLRFIDLLRDLGIHAERTALPGVQDKASAAMLNVPVARSGFRYFLKLTPPEYPHLVENEFWFLQAARQAGLQAASAELIRDGDGAPGLLVTRFDRLPAGPDERPRPLAVEDACQVLGVPPADKYRLTSEGALHALASACQAPLPAARTFLMQLTFAYLTGNGDAHGKNFSILQSPDGEWLPSPAYDVPSSQPYGDTTMALSVNGRVDDPGGDDFVALGRALGLPERAAARVLADQADRVDAWLPLLDNLPFDAGSIRKLKRVIAHRRKRVSQAR